MDSLWLLSILLLAISGVSFYSLSRAFYGRFASSACAVIYVIFPYHLVNLYWRGALPEFAAFAVAPLVILFAFQLGRRARALDYVGMGLSFGALMLVHSPSAYLMTWALALYSFLLFIQTRSFRPVIRLAAGVAAGLLVSAIYWLPAALEAKYAFENISTLFPYVRSYLPRPPWAPPFWQALSAALFAQLILLAGSLWVLRYISTQVRRNLNGETAGTGPVSDEASDDAGTSRRVTIRTQAIMAITTLLMSTFLSAPIALILPRIELVSFAFRWLMFSCVFTLLVSAAAADRLFAKANTALRRRNSLALLLTALAALNVGVTIKFVMIEAAASPPLRATQQLIESTYTPKDGARPQNLPAAPQAAFELVGGAGGTLEIKLWDPQHRKIQADSSVQNVLRLRTYYFPGWSATLDGKVVPLRADPAGVQLVDTPAGRHTVEIFLADTPARTFGKALSVAGLLIIVMLAARGYAVGRRSGGPGTPDPGEKRAGISRNDFGRL
jgi:hypothetical protein